ILCSLSYPIIEIVAACRVGLVGRLASNDDDFPGFVDFHPRNTHTRSGDGLDGSGQVALSEICRPTAHCRSSKLSPSGPNAGLLKRRYSRVIAAAASANCQSVSGTCPGFREDGQGGSSPPLSTMLIATFR